MRAIDLSLFELLTLPRNQGELLRGMNGLTSTLGAVRFAYIQLPTPFDLLKRGIYPRMLTNFPDYVMSRYVREATEPFSYCTRALATRRPVFFNEAVLPEEVYFVKLSVQAGFHDGVIIPVNGSDDSVIAYVFDRPVNRDWVRSHYASNMVLLNQMVDMAIKANPDLAPPFIVPGLTPRVQEILQYKVQGLTNERIAKIIGVRHDTVKKTLRRFSERLGGLSTTELIYHLTKMGML